MLPSGRHMTPALAVQSPLARALLSFGQKGGWLTSALRAAQAAPYRPQSSTWMSVDSGAISPLTTLPDPLTGKPTSNGPTAQAAVSSDVRKLASVLTTTLNRRLRKPGRSGLAARPAASARQPQPPLRRTHNSKAAAPASHINHVVGSGTCAITARALALLMALIHDASTPPGFK
jgi:hypothetical protein